MSSIISLFGQFRIGNMHPWTVFPLSFVAHTSVFKGLINYGLVDATHSMLLCFPIFDSLSPELIPQIKFRETAVCRSVKDDVIKFKENDIWWLDNGGRGRGKAAAAINQKRTGKHSGGSQTRFPKWFRERITTYFWRLGRDG